MMQIQHMRASLVFLLLFVAPPVLAQPQPGDVFREYVWVPDMVNERGKFLRVGGSLDYQVYPDYFPADAHQDGHIPMADAFDLEGAMRAEVVLEMVQSHDDTKGLHIQINGNDWIPISPLAAIPKPQSAYMFHAYPVTSIPLEHFHHGPANTFKLQVDSTQRWGWPQHLFYGVIVRIYYEAPDQAIQAVRLVGITPGSPLAEEQTFSLEAAKPGAIMQVDYVGLYDDFNWEGNGRFRQWHYHFHQGTIRNHIGTSTKAPFRITWDTSWLPDQSQSIQLAARVVHSDGLIYMTPPIEDLRLERDYAVELARPYRQPTNWATREDSIISYIALHGDPSNAESMQIGWRSWSPCYAEGVFINSVEVWDKEDVCYEYAEHRIKIKNPDFLKRGENIISTGLTPRVDGQMMHGMEVQWPGIMMKVKYHTKPEPGIRITDGTYAGRPHFLVHTPTALYYYDKAGGGLSRMIDADGNDWIGFWDTPWEPYPDGAASAFRGVPNLVYQSDDGGAGHPGHTQCISEQIGENRIRSTSKSGNWEWEWTFFDDHARLDVQKVDTTHAYWFLYEGIPGGVYEPEHQYMGTNTGGPRIELRDFFHGDKLFDKWQWAYFGHNDVDRILYVAQQSPDEHSDTFSYLGNTETGLDSPDGMIVFGFGRTDGAKPLLKEPESFVVGFWEQAIIKAADHDRLAKEMRDVFKP